MRRTLTYFCKTAANQSYRNESTAIQPALESQTVQEFLRTLGYSQRLIIQLKQLPVGILIDGQPARAIHLLKSGETLTVTLPPEEASPNIVKTAMDLDIVYEDEDLMVLNKDSGVPIHPSQGNYDNSLANGIAWYFAEKSEPFTFRVINRLDRDTTGLLIIAKHALSACILSDMIQARTIHRTYLAAVSGDLRKTIPVSIPSDSWITLSAPIGRVDGSTIERQVDKEHGEPAVTHYRFLSYQKELDASLAELKLETGRTHQIRVHMKHLGHPLFGDFLYHPDFRFLNRQSLHSWKLDFLHPITKEPLAFAAAVPEDMRIFTDGVPLDNDF